MFAIERPIGRTFAPSDGSRALRSNSGTSAHAVPHGDPDRLSMLRRGSESCDPCSRPAHAVHATVAAARRRQMVQRGCYVHSRLSPSACISVHLLASALTKRPSRRCHAGYGSVDGTAMHQMREAFPVLRSSQQQAVSAPVLVVIDPGSAEVVMPTQCLHRSKAGVGATSSPAVISTDVDDRHKASDDDEDCLVGRSYRRPVLNSF